MSFFDWMVMIMKSNSLEIIFLADEVNPDTPIEDLIKLKALQVEDEIRKIDETTPVIIQEALFNFLALLKSKELENESAPMVN